MAQNKTRKNHYIPSFYSGRWAGDDGKVCEFRRPYRSVKPRRTHPEGTGYAVDLYTELALPEEVQTYLEDVFLKRVDQQASDALPYIMAGRFDDMNLVLRQAWVRFLMSMLQRSPGGIASLRQKWDEELSKDDDGLQARYGELRRPEDPETFAEFMRLEPARIARGGIRAIQSVMDLPKVGGHILNMTWSRLEVRRSRFEFLTSDRPVIMTNGLGKKEGHIAIPVGPRTLFLAANEKSVAQEAASLPSDELIGRCNKIIVEQTEGIVLGRTDKALSFIEKHLRPK